MDFFGLVVTLFVLFSQTTATLHASNERIEAFILPAVVLAEVLELILREDNPEELSVLLNDYPRFKWDISINTILDRMIENDRFECFRRIFPRVDYDDLWKTRLVNNAIQFHRVEICDYLLDQNFRIDHSVFGIWQSPYRWDNVELIGLMSRHPDRIRDFAPGPYYWLDKESNVYTALIKLDFIHHCRSINEAFAAHQDFEPTFLIKIFVNSNRLGDTDTAKVFEKLFLMGAVLEPDDINVFKLVHPRHCLSVQFLVDAIRGPDIKEPECN
jgi:hypothetical protein